MWCCGEGEGGAGEGISLRKTTQQQKQRCWREIPSPLPLPPRCPNGWGGGRSREERGSDGQTANRRATPQSDDRQSVAFVLLTRLFLLNEYHARFFCCKSCKLDMSKHVYFTRVAIFTLVNNIRCPEMATFLTDASIPSVSSRREEAPTRQSCQLVCPRYQRSLEA